MSLEAKSYKTMPRMASLSFVGVPMCSSDHEEYAIGNTSGYARSLDVKAVSAWAASSEGQAAYKLDQDGDLRSLIRCDRDGWTVQRSQDGKHMLCNVRPASDGLVSGWYVP
jgi:hypothetical protein